MREALTDSGAYTLEPAPLVDPRAIELAHDAEYVRRFLAGELSANEMRRIGFPWSEGLVRRTLASAGATLAAAEDALASGFGGTLAGGTHHAARAAGSGFCVFNDIAIAIRRLHSGARAQRAAVVDLDVHQGDGTAEILGGDPYVLTSSIHGRNNFPFRKCASTIDVALEDGVGDKEYLDVVAQLLPRVWAWSPDIVFYQSGVDVLASDRLGKLSLTPAGVATRDHEVLAGCHARGIPVVVTLGGGYSDPIELTVEAHTNTFLTAARIFTAQGAH